MRLAFCLNSRTALPPSALARYAAQAEEHGYDAVMLTEAQNDVFPYAVACAHLTSRVSIGTSIANLGLRHPALMALSAAETDDLAGGRFILGLGLGTQWFTPEGAGPARERPVRAVREYVELLRALWRGESRYEGQIYQLHDFAMDFTPRRSAIPIYLAGVGPQMCRLAGAIADGVHLGVMPVDRIPEAIGHVAEGARRVGRDPSRVVVACMLRVLVDDDLARAREAARRLLVMYVGFGSYARYFAAIGYADIVAGVGAALARGDAEAAARQVPDELVDSTAVYGDATRCREQLAAYLRAGVQLAVAMPRQTSAPWDVTLQHALEALAPR
ncbi:MAG: LLM class flavin-dependent oxidoreductase [Chloroflexi bacterium]|nr:LLM class flavin-dependent oxidoreductase [Chloroflexota bacterium]